MAIDLSKYKLPATTTPPINPAGIDLNKYKLNSLPSYNPPQTFGSKILGGVSKVGEFLGVGTFAKGVGLSLARLSPEIRNIEKKISAGTATPDELDFYKKQYGEEAPTGKQIIGSALQTAATIGTAGLGNIGGANAGLRIGKAALQGAGVGSVMGFGKGLEENKPILGALKEGAITGAVSGAVGAGLQGGSELIKSIADKFPKRIMDSVLKQSKAQNLAGKNVSEYALQKSKIGTVDSLISGSQETINKLNTNIDNQLGMSASKGIKINSNVLFDNIATQINKEGGDITSVEVQKIVDNLAPQVKGLLKKEVLTVKEANNLRKLLDKTLGDRGFLVQQLPFNKEVLMDFANGLRNKVQTYVPQTAPLFNEMSKEITFRNALLNRASSVAKNQILSLTDLLAGVVGSPGGLPGALGAIAVKKTLTSTPFLTGSAVLINQLNTKIAPLLGKLTPIEKIGVLNVIKESFSSPVSP